MQFWSILTFPRGSKFRGGGAWPGLVRLSSNLFPVRSNVGGSYLSKQIYPVFLYAIPGPGSIRCGVPFFLSDPLPLYLSNFSNCWGGKIGVGQKWSQLPFQTLWGDSGSDPGDWCIPRRVRGGLAIRWGWRCLISDGANLVTSTCHSHNHLWSHEEAAMPHQIGIGCSSRKYGVAPATGSKLVASLPRNWRHCLLFRRKCHIVHLKKSHF